MLLPRWGWINLPSRFGASIACYRMDIDKTIAEIEWLEWLLSLPDPRPLQASDRDAANQRHDQVLAHNPWFRLWQRYGIPS